MKTILLALVRLFFRFRSYNTGVLSTPGPVLLVPNHVSWLDWLFVAVCLDDDWRFVTSSTTAETSWLHKRIMVNRRTFPIDPSSPYAAKRMAEYLQKGGRLVLFAEGQISHTGVLMKIYDGTGFLLFKTRAKVITCYLRGANRLVFSRQPGWRRWFPRVTAHFGEVERAPDLGEVRAATARRHMTDWLRDRMVTQQFRVETEFGAQNLVEAIEDAGRERPGLVVLEDATRKTLTYRRLLAGADVVSMKLATRVRADDRVGVLLPNLNVTPVVLMALWRLDKVPAVLNFSTGPAVMVACCRLAGLKHVITSRAFVTKAKLDVKPLEESGVEVLYLEDLGVVTADRVWGMVRAFVHLALPKGGQDLRMASSRTAVVLFTSGSEGVPKGVELTHGNILANIRQMIAVTDLEDKDRLFNALPLFHSFGLTVGTFLPLVRGLYTFLYPSPLHYRLIPAAIYDRNCSLFLSTNTFLNGYARKAHPYDFRSMRYLFAAAEKLQESTASTWSRLFGVRVLEGYGATECAPCLSVNTPLNPRYGSVGRLLPGIEYRLESIEGVSTGGRLFVRGPNVMRGYLNADANEKFLALDGWYDTGDIVSVDESGFLFIQGRMKRFAKVSGEMVSLTAVEDALAGAFPHYGLRCQVAVVSVPDEARGEVLIAAANESRLTMEEVRAAIKAKGLSNLCVPREIVFVREIPKLGTGKTNHRELEKLIAARGQAQAI